MLVPFSRLSQFQRKQFCGYKACCLTGEKSHLEDFSPLSNKGMFLFSSFSSFSALKNFSSVLHFMLF